MTIGQKLGTLFWGNEMKKSTDVLREEHNAILKILDAVEEAARRLNRNLAVAPETLSGLLEFLQIFADRCHHGKEEDCLFPLLEKKGMPHDAGPLAVMLHEHGRGRELIRNMKQALEGLSSGRSDAGSQWAAAALNYAELLRGHIAKENEVLFPMADRLLSGDEQSTLVNSFEQIETDKIGAGTHERLHELMKKLHADIFPRK
jgi:hemerythrin-like domain-containing protein